MHWNEHPYGSLPTWTLSRLFFVVHISTQWEREFIPTHKEWVLSWFLTDIELILFAVAGVVLCFGFRGKLMITYCFSCYRAVLTQCQRPSSFSLCPAGKEAGRAQELGKGTARTGDSNCLYLNPQILFISHLPFHWGGEHEVLCGAYLPARLNHKCQCDFQTNYIFSDLFSSQRSASVSVRVTLLVT